jgi:hypothetical protein
MKNVVFIVDNTFEEARRYFDSYFSPICNFTRSGKYDAETETAIIKFMSYANPESLRGYLADVVYVNEKVPQNVMRDYIIPLASNNGARIRLY